MGCLLRLFLCFKAETTTRWNATDSLSVERVVMVMLLLYDATTNLVGLMLTVVFAYQSICGRVIEV